MIDMDHVYKAAAWTGLALAYSEPEQSGGRC
jgi:hypothetical protein